MADRQRSPHPAFNSEVLEARRRSARKLAWLLALGVLILYVGGLFVAR